MSIINYPTTFPVNSLYLPLNRRREYLSITDQCADPQYNFVSTCIEKYSSSDYFDKDIATGVLYSLITSLNVNLNVQLMPNEALSTSAKLRLITDQVILTIGDKILAKDVYRKICKIILDWLNCIHLENPSVSVQPFFALPKEDFQIAEENYESYKLNNRVAMCFDFAFYKLNETNAFPYIFNAQEKTWPTCFVRDPVKQLGLWGYDLVTEPKEGDLVVYCLSSNERIEAKHWGFWTSDNHVISKFGIGDVMKHPVDDVGLSYGNFVYFFHKKIKSLTLQSYLKEIKTASRSVEDFSHKATRSPLSASGCVAKMIQIFENIKITGILKNSLFNEEYNLRVKKIYFNLLYQLTKDLKFSSKIDETLDEIQELIYTASTFFSKN